MGSSRRRLISVRCSEARYLISLMVDGELPPRKKGALDEHLRSCAECRAFAASTRQLDTLLLAYVPQGRAPEGFRDRVMEALPAAPAARPGPRGAHWRLRFALGLAAAVVVLAVTAGSVLVHLRAGRLQAKAPENVTMFNMPASGTAPESGAAGAGTAGGNEDQAAITVQDYTPNRVAAGLKVVPAAGKAGEIVNISGTGLGLKGQADLWLLDQSGKVVTEVGTVTVAGGSFTYQWQVSAAPRESLQGTKSALVTASVPISPGAYVLVIVPAGQDPEHAVYRVPFAVTSDP